jgi:hypothetical protein
MNEIKHKGQNAFQDQYGGVYMFGKSGFIDEVDGVMIAHITERGKRLADARYSDLAAWKCEPQELKVLDGGLKGMCAHLRIPLSHRAQKSLTTYEYRVYGKNTKIRVK